MRVEPRNKQSAHTRTPGLFVVEWKRKPEGLCSENMSLRPCP